MNENMPPTDLGKPEATSPAAPLPPVVVPPPRIGPTPWQGGGIGLLIFVISVVLCYANPIFFLIGFAGAVVSLFYKGYRTIFIGYILILGVTLLGVIIYCSTQPFDIK